MQSLSEPCRGRKQERWKPCRKPSVTESVPSKGNPNYFFKLRGKEGPHESRCGKQGGKASSQSSRETGKKTARMTRVPVRPLTSFLILGRDHYPLVPRGVIIRARSYPAWDPGEGTVPIHALPMATLVPPHFSPLNSKLSVFCIFNSL